MDYKEYIGDSVYADFDGYAFVLTTENNIKPSNTIILKPQIMEALKEYVKRISRLIDPSVDRIE